MLTCCYARPASVGAALVLALLVVAGCGGAQKEGAGEVTPVSFVGEIEEANSFVALVASEPQDGGEREVRAYLCDGNLVNDWFRGSTSGDELAISSDNETQLQGQLDPDAATGTITSPEGDSVSFEAFPATGIAGLYNVTLSSDGILSGASEGGGRVEGELGDQLEDGSYPVSGTFNPPDGEEPQDFEAFIDDDAPRDLRWIVLPDGQVRGGPFGQGGGGFNFQGGFQGGGFQGGIQGGNFQGGGFNLQGGGNFQGGFNFPGGGFQGGIQGGNFQGGGFNQGGFNLQGGGGGKPGDGGKSDEGGSGQAGGGSDDASGKAGGGGDASSDQPGGGSDAPDEADAGGEAGGGEGAAGDGGLNFASSGAGGDGGGKGKGGGSGGKGKGGGGKGDKGKGGNGKGGNGKNN